MRITVDGSRCQGTGFCARVAPRYFTLENKVASVLRASVDPADEEQVREAEDLCPTRAILTASEELLL